MMSVLAASLAVVSYLHVDSVWVIDLIAALRGTVLVFNNPSRQALIVQLVGRGELQNAIALNSSINNATRVLGPAVAGLLIASVGVPACFALNAVSYSAAIFALTAMRPAEFHTGHIRSRVPLLVSIREGIRYASKTKTIAIALLMLFTISLFSINFNVLLPVLARQTLHGGAQTYGLIAAFFGLGAFVGAIMSASRQRASRGLLLLAAAAFGLGEIIVALTTSIPVVCLALFLTGASYTLYTSSTNAIVQLATPGFLQGRVAGLYSYVFIGSGPFGALLAGWLSERGGTALAFWVAGLVAFIMALIGFATRPWPMPAGSVGSLRRLRLPWTTQDVRRRHR